MFSIGYLKAWFFSAVAYDEDNCVEIIESAFPNHTAHFEGTKGSAHFYGMVVDKVNRTAYLVCRGTDGKNLLAKTYAWYKNIETAHAGPDGVGDGAQDIGNDVFDRFKSRLYDYPCWIHTGHSWGGMACQRTAQLNCRHGGEDQHVLCYPFAAPSIFKEPAGAEMTGYINGGVLTLERTYVPGDPLGSVSIAKNLGAEEVGERIILPDPIMQKVGPIDILCHSPRIYTAMVAMRMMESDIVGEKRYILNETFKRCTN